MADEPLISDMLWMKEGFGLQMQFIYVFHESLKFILLVRLFCVLPTCVSTSVSLVMCTGIFWEQT